MSAHPTTNRQIKLAARPQGMADAQTWQTVDAPLDGIADGEVLVKVLYLSIDPAMRGWIRAADSYIQPVQVGETMRAIAAGRVIASKNTGFAVGDHVTGLLGAQAYAVSNGQGLLKIDPRMAPLPRWLGAFGMPGMTAWFGLQVTGELKDGDTVVVSGAAGAVGSVVGQIAKARGCKVIGIAGGADKCRYLTDELGFDAAIDYKAEDVAAKLAQHCPDGLNVYFDNVGGEILDAALTRLAQGARIVLCGAISQYNSSTVQGPKNYLALLTKRATMRGIVVTDFYHRAGEMAQGMTALAVAGKLKMREDIVDGLDAFPRAFNMLFKGENHGKLVLRVAAE